MGNFRRIARAAGLLILLGMAAGPARGQVAPSGFFSDPILIFTGEGHHAPVRSMTFTPDGLQLLTGGMDKAVRVWNLGPDRTRLARTLRPPTWRGLRGDVYALALTAKVVEGNQRLLAVAGHGVLGSRGEILLFDYPGPTGQGTGDIRGQLSSVPARAGRPAEPGHTDVVTSMAFTPDGKFLASASNDRTVRIWDVAARHQVSVLDQASGPVNAVAIFAAGTKLAAGGRDGGLRLYDITDRARPRFIAQAAPNPPTAANPLAGTILGLAATPDGSAIFVGTEGGRLIRHNGVTLAATMLASSTGPVEGVAVSPDGQLLATSTVARNLAGLPDDPRTVACVVQVRSIPTGAVLETLPATNNLVFALAFSPDSRRLAYSGGDSQSIFLKVIGAGAPPAEEVPGHGSSVWDVGFRVDNQAIRFARTRPAAPGQAPEYQAFHLRDRFLYDPAPDEPAYRHAVDSESGWTILPGVINRVDFLNARGGRWLVQLDPEDERRHYSHTMIPPNPAAGHADPVAAVGCASGVVLWNLANGNRTRFFNGHAGPVYSMASSPDGKWLVTGSLDQTVRIWPLAGCDKPPPFGARFERRADGSWVVADVTPGGFADGIKLKKGHVIEKLFVGDREQTKAQIDALLPGLDAQPATIMYTFDARMGREPETLYAGTTKRDSAALIFFPASNREWIFWTPRGQYDTSVEGDRRYLGWLTNQGSVTQLQAALFDSIDKFERRFRQPKAPTPNVLDQLLETGAPLAAQAGLPPVPAEVAGPDKSLLSQNSLTPVGPPVATGPGFPVVAQGGRLLVDYTVQAARNAAKIVRIALAINGRILARPEVVGDGSLVKGQFEFQVPPGVGPVSLTMQTEDAAGIVRESVLTASNPARAAPKPRHSRLRILAIGSEEFNDQRLPPIQHARADAVKLAQFLKDRLIDRATGTRFDPNYVRVQTFVDRDVAAGPLTAALDALAKGEGDDRLREDDTVALVIESHFLSHQSRALVATAEPAVGPAPPSISAADLADRLGALTQLGCRVFVLLDAIHEVPALLREEQSGFKDWIRKLQSNSHVAVFVATDHGPSRPTKASVGPHRVFAQGVLSVLETRNAGRLRQPENGPMNLFDFQRTLIDSVLENSGRKQHARVYLPEILPPETPFLDDAEIPKAQPVSLKR